MSLVNQMLQDLDQRQAQDAHEFIQRNDCLTQVDADGKSGPRALRSLFMATCVVFAGTTAFIIWQGAGRTPDMYYQVDADLLPAGGMEADSIAASEPVTPFVPLDWSPAPGLTLVSNSSNYEIVATLDIEPPMSTPEKPSNDVFAPSHGPLPAARSPQPENSQPATRRVAETPQLKTDNTVAETEAVKAVEKDDIADQPVPAAEPQIVAVKQPQETISIKPAETSAHRSYQQARVHLDNWETHEARRELSRTLVFDPGHNAARELLVALLLQDRQHTEAESIIDVGLALYPGHSPFAQLKARLMSARGETGLAIEMLRSVTPSPKHSFEHNSILAALYQKDGNHERAARTYLALIELRPEAASLWSGLAMSLDAQGQLQAALKSYKHALSTQRLSPELRRYAQQRVEAINTAIGENS